MRKAGATLLFILAFLLFQGAETRAILVFEMPLAAQSGHQARLQREPAVASARLDGTGSPLPADALSGRSDILLAERSNTPPGSPAAFSQALAANDADEGEEESEVDLEGEEEEDDLDEDLEGEFGESLDAELYDPFSGYNRAMTSFNDGVYVYLFDPAARGYRYVVPEIGRRGVSNFFQNLLFPLRFVNNLLQAEFLDAGEEFLRFCINTTIGILGIWDPAEDWFGLEAHDEDFGQTLAVWGVGTGPHIVLPFLGPSNLRDLSGEVPDYYLDPLRFVDPKKYEYGLRVYDIVNDTSLHIGEYENLKKDAFDLYPFLRDVYEQNRQKKVLE